MCYAFKNVPAMLQDTIKCHFAQDCNFYIAHSLRVFYFYRSFHPTKNNLGLFKTYRTHIWIFEQSRDTAMLGH